MSKNATRNSNAPTGKTAAIKIPDPIATAKIPRIQLPPPPAPRYMPCASSLCSNIYGADQNGAKKPPERIPTVFSLFFVFLPVFQRLQFLIEPQVTLVPASLNLSLFTGFQNRTALFFRMVAAYKAAFTQIRHKITERFR